MSIFSRPWLVLWAILLGTGWLLPNHYYPWGSFHTDAWISTAFLIAGFAVIIRSVYKFEWHAIAVLALISSFVPFLQYLSGQLFFSGQAWICFIYLFAFCLVMLIGSQWESTDPNQAADALFLGVGIGAFFSVGIQLYQWLELRGLEFWTMDAETGRYFANFGQPNQLGTFLIWGILACGWGVTRDYIRPSIATIGVAFLIFGIALTQSRTSLVVLAILLVFAFFWWKYFQSQFSRKVLLACLFYCFFCYWIIPKISSTLGVGNVPDIAERSLFSARAAAYALFIDALWQHPWLGYGWSNVPYAQFVASLNKPALTLFAHSHNLFLDLMLWCGIPLGGFISFYLCVWFAKVLRAIHLNTDAILAMFVIAISVHAMLELPLHYAYFLLPTGLVIGMLNKKFDIHLFIKVDKSIVTSLMGAGAIVLIILIRDYSEVEQNFLAYRFEVARIGTQPPKEAPDVMLLTQFHALMTLVRMEPGTNLAASDLTWMENVAIVYSSPANMLKVAKAFAINGHPDQAILWMRRMEKILSEKELAPVKNNWKKTMEKAELNVPAWPEIQRAPSQ